MLLYIYDILSSQIESGNIIVNSATNIDERLNMVDLVWGGRDREDLFRTAELIKSKLGITS